MPTAALSISDIGVIYSAVLSTATATIGGTRWWRRRKVDVSFSYGWAEARDEYGTLTIRVHNNSPLATIHLLQIGWQGDKGAGDWWEPPGASVAVEAGATYSQEFTVGTVPESVVASAMLGDRSIREGQNPFRIQYAGVSKSGDAMTLRSDA